MATCTKVISDTAVLTTSNAPALTPPEVMTASAPRALASAIALRRSASTSSHRRLQDDIGAGAAGERRQQQRVGLGDLPALELRARRQQLGARRDDRDPRAPADGHRCDVRCGDRGKLQRAELDSRGNELRARGAVFTAPPDVRADATRRLPHPDGSERVGQPAGRRLERHDRVGVRGQRRAGHDPHRLARAERGVERAAGGEVGHDAEGDGGCRARGRDIGEAHREPVHRGVVEQRQIHGRAHTGSEGAAEGLGQTAR